MSGGGLARAFVRFVQWAVPAQHEGTWILAYHLVGGHTDTVVDIPVRTFERHLDLISCNASWLRLSDWSAPDPGGIRVVITFDDAFANFGDVVWPMLRDRGIPATLFVPTGFIDGRCDSPLRGARLPACSWRALADMASEGLELGSHTDSHKDLRKQTRRQVLVELQVSRDRIAMETAVEPTSFCYPQAKWNHTTRRAVADVYRVAVRAGGRMARAVDDPVSLPRLPLRNDMTLRQFELALRAPLWLEEVVADRFRRYA